MAIEFNPNEITSGYNLSKLNENFTKIETALNDGLSRSGSSPNQMGSDIDMDSNDILNVKNLEATNIKITGVGEGYTVVVRNNLLTEGPSAAEIANAESYALRAEAAALLYQVSASPPTTRADGSPLQAGDQYYNTGATELFVWNGLAWVSMESTTFSATPKSFVGNGSQTVFTLDVIPGIPSNVIASVGGVPQIPTTDYTVSGTSLTFLEAPPINAPVATLVLSTAARSQLPANGSVTAATLTNDPVALQAIVDKLPVASGADVITPYITPEMFGAVGDGVTDDTQKIKDMIASIGAGKGAIVFIPKTYKLTSKVSVNNKTLCLQGRSFSGSDGEWTGFNMSGDGELELTGCSGVRVERIGLRGLADFTPQHDLVSMYNSANCTFHSVGWSFNTNTVGGKYIKVTQGSNRTRFIDIQASGARGEYGFYLGGPTPPDNATGANIFDFSVFSIGALDACDAIVFDGATGSARFVNGAMNFGRRAIWVKRGGFFYFNACGWENHTGDYTLDFERAKNTSIVGCYLNGGLRVGELSSDFRILGNIIRAGKYHGVDFAGIQIKFADNTVLRNSVDQNFTYSGVKLQSTCKNTHITGNMISREWGINDTTNTQVLNNALHKYAIDNDAPSGVGNRISGNTLTEYTTAPIGGSVVTGPHIFDNLTS